MEINNEIIIIQNLDANQIANANLIVLTKSRIKYYLFFIVLIFFLNLIINYSYFNFKDFLLPIAVFFFIPFFIWKSMKRSAKRILKSNVRFFKNVNYIFNANTFLVKGDNFENKYNWNEINKIIETKNWFLIYITNYNTIAIDKKQQNANDITNIKELFNSLDIKKSLK